LNSTTRYLGNALSNETTTVGFTARLTNLTLDLGPQTLYYYFEYRPNPILQDVYPLTTILRSDTASNTYKHKIYKVSYIVLL